MDLTVVIPTHNPGSERLQRTLRGLLAQTLTVDRWETVLVDNASATPVRVDANWGAPTNLRVVEESTLGLTAARRRGFAEAKSNVVVLVDDDNVLAPDYLTQVMAAFDRYPGVGAIGGRSLPDFGPTEPEDWTREFHALLAVRDLGPTPLVSAGLRPAGVPRNQYPPFAPIGAGMALRRPAWKAWLDRGHTGLSDRRGRDLSSGGDNDIVLCAMAAGWEVAYVPELSLTHLIPATRLEPAYLARLNRGIQSSWMEVLTLHDANPWPPLTITGAKARKFKAWLTHRPWSSPAARIRYAGACGHFDGRVPR